jgi:glycosyltransferase involved in cell wall biosynthesis
MTIKQVSRSPDIDEHIDVSLIICTRNRAESLAKTLEAVRHQQLPDGRTWELLVVDNGSTDDTRSVLETAAARHPALRHVLEPRAGLSAARRTRRRGSTARAGRARTSPIRCM